MICNCLNPDDIDHCLNCGMCRPQLQCKDCDYLADAKTELMTVHILETGHKAEQVRKCPKCQDYLLVDHGTETSYKHRCGVVFFIKSGIISVIGQKLSRKSKYRQRRMLEKKMGIVDPSIEESTSVAS